MSQICSSCLFHLPCFSSKYASIRCLLYFFFSIFRPISSAGIFLLDRFSEAERSLLAFHQELKQLSDTKRAFEHASDELDEALSRSLAIVLRPNGKQPLDCDEPDRCTEARRKVFLQESIDYVRQIRSLRLQKNSHLLETLLRITDSGIREYHHQVSMRANKLPFNQPSNKPTTTHFTFIGCCLSINSPSTFELIDV